MNRTKFLSLSNIAVLILVLSQAKSVFSQVGEAGDLHWADISQEIADRSSKVKQIYATGVIQSYYSSKLREKSYQQWKKSDDPDNVPVPLDDNNVSSLSWFNDVDKWRLDIRRSYPTLGLDFKQQSFDGEKYTFYNEYNKVGAISASPDESISIPFLFGKDFRKFSDDNAFGGGMISYLQKNYMVEGEEPKFEKEEKVDGEVGEKFNCTALIDGANSDLSFWFSKKYNTFLKITVQSTNAVNKSGSFLIYKASDFKSAGPIFLPYLIKEENYKVLRGDLTWLNTRIASLDDVEVNDKNSISAFGHPVRVTAVMQNILENPGLLKQTSGLQPNMISSVKSGAPPSLEIPGLVAEGAAPEVLTEQEKREIHPSMTK